MNGMIVTQGLTTIGRLSLSGPGEAWDPESCSGRFRVIIVLQTIPLLVRKFLFIFTQGFSCGINHSHDSGELPVWNLGSS